MKKFVDNLKLFLSTNLSTDESVGKRNGKFSTKICIVDELFCR